MITKIEAVRSLFGRDSYEMCRADGLVKWIDGHTTTAEETAQIDAEETRAIAAEQANANAEQSIMIGDDLAVDVLGAEKVGMQGIYFNPNKKEHKEEVAHEIFCLSELMALL